jgi:hypothetical protein
LAAQENHHSGGGRLSVEAGVPCDVSIDGKARGRTPIFDVAVSAGRHQVRCEGGGLALPLERVVKIAAGTKQPVTFALGRINVGDLNPWAQVFLDGKRVDRTPTSLRVLAGTHRVRLVGEGRDVSRNVVASPNQPVMIDRW